MAEFSHPPQTLSEKIEEDKISKTVGAESSHGDVEKQVPSGDGNLQRKLKSRHLQMIAIGGTIGTGLFIATGTALTKTGPVGMLIAYAFIGTVVFTVMISLGEMATFLPVAGAFSSYASRFVDPSLGFAMGWLYWFSWAITYALELTAAGLVIQYWRPDLNIGIFIAVFWVFFTGVNLLPVRFYGELEFWFASIKVIALAGFMIFAICVDAGVGKQGYLGFHNWAHPGPFATYLSPPITNENTAKFVGFWSVLVQAGFAYQGTELVGIAAGETANPGKTVPSAIRKTFWRILFFFVLTVFFIGLLVPYDNELLLTESSDASASPLVIAAKLAGVQVLPGIINAVILTVVLSAANSNVYSGSRILVGLANQNLGPRCLTRASKGGVPYIAVACTAVFGFLGFLNLSNNGGEVFNWLLNITAVAGFIAWATIARCHIGFMRILKYRGISRDSLPYKAPWEPYTAWYALFWCVIIIFTQGFTTFIPWSTEDFFVAYISLILFVVLYVGHKAVTRSSLVTPQTADIDTGRVQYGEAEIWEEKGRSTWRKVWNLVS